MMFLISRAFKSCKWSCCSPHLALSIVTLAKRRENASFSICFWYLPGVVAPIRSQSSTPRLFQDIGHPESNQSATRAHDGMELIDKEGALSIFFNILDDIVHALFKVTIRSVSLQRHLIKSSSNTRIFSHSQAISLTSNTLSEPKRQGCFPDTSIPNQDRIFFWVLRLKI